MPKSVRSPVAHIAAAAAGVGRRPVRLRESATTAERTEVRETVQIAISEAPRDSSDGMEADLLLISAGWNKAGTRYYPQEVLLRDIPTAYEVGTHQHWNHQTVTESIEQPERSLSTLAAVITDKPYSPDGGKTMRAKAKVFGPYQPVMREVWKHIGVSINADGTGHYGEAEGRKGLIVDSIEVGKSVDFVTKAGAGGKILSLLESAREAAAQQSTDEPEATESPGLTREALAEAQRSLGGPGLDTAIEVPKELAEAAQQVVDTVALREARNMAGWLEARLHLAATEMLDDLYGNGRLTREERITLSGALGDALKAWTARVDADASQLSSRDIWQTPESQQLAVDASESHRLAEATSEEVRRALDAAVSAAYATGDDEYAWIRDYDADAGVVWFEASKDKAKTWGQSYAVDDDGVVSLSGERYEVVARTTYDKVPPPAEAIEESVRPAESVTPEDVPAADAVVDENAPGDAPDNPNKEEGAPMPEDQETIAAREAAEKALVEANAARDAALKEAADAKAAAADSAARLALLEAKDSAAPIVSAKLAESDLLAPARARVQASVMSRVPLSESNKLDKDALTSLIEAEVTAEAAYVASLAEADGAGKVRGAGGTSFAETVGAPVASDAAVKQLTEAYISRGMSPETARLCAAGRPL